MYIYLESLLVFLNISSNIIALARKCQYIKKCWVTACMHICVCSRFIVIIIYI